VHIDHVIYATNDLDAAAERLEAELGLPTLPGGRHEGLGTHNRIMPLGGGYLELLAVADSEEMSHSALGVATRTLIEQTADGLAMWAVAVDDVGPIAARLGTSVIEIARQGLSASLTGLLESTREPFLPFFISRHHGVADPGSGGDAGGISWIEVGGDAARLEEWNGGAVLPVRVVEGAAGVRAVGIGNRELRTGLPARNPREGENVAATPRDARVGMRRWGGSCASGAA
jgi:hypothetical protein